MTHTSIDFRSRLWRLRLWRTAVITGALAIFIGSAIPGGSLPAMKLFTMDKLLHYVEFALFGWLLCGWVRLEFPRRRPVWIVLLLGALYATSDEVHQLMVAGRSCDIYDWLADVAGVATALIATGTLWPRRGAAGNKNRFQAS